MKVNSSVFCSDRYLAGRVRTEAALSPSTSWIGSLIRVHLGRCSGAGLDRLGHARSDCGVVPAPRGSTRSAAGLLGRGDRGRAPAPARIRPAVAADRGPTSVDRGLARPGAGHPRPHHVLAAQPWAGAGHGAGTSAGGRRAGARRDRRDRAEGLRRGRVAGGDARRPGKADVAQTPPRGRSRGWRNPRLRADHQRGRRRVPSRPLLEQISGPLGPVAADGAYDGEPVTGPCPSISPIRRWTWSSRRA